MGRRTDHLAAAGQVTAGNVVSRVTGLLRVLAVAGALGTTFLGNTYQTANLVSNLLFELLAAGLLSAVLVPPFVRLIEGGRRAEAEELAGSLLWLVLVSLGAVTIAAMVARPWIMRGLTLAVPDAEVRASEIRLGSFLLAFFLPQVLLYAVGAVATALLHATHRFAAAAFAPVANNLIVIATMAAFWATGGGTAGLEVSASQRLILALGTTAGVAAMTAVPLVAVRRAGLRLRPRWAPDAEGLRGLARAGAWGGAYLAFGQVLVATTLVLANRTEGGVVAYQLAFTGFLLPHAVLAHPVATTLYPRLAAEVASGRAREFSRLLGSGVRTLAFRVAPASALLVVLGAPALGLVRLGALDAGGAGLAAKVLAAYAVGLVGYSALHLLTRASYSLGDTRGPALVNLGVAAAGSVLMVLGSMVVGDPDDRVMVLGLAHSAAMLGGAVVLGALLRRQVAVPWPTGAPVARALACATAAALLGRALAGLMPVGGRVAAALTIVVVGSAVTLVYLAGQWALGAPEVGRRLLVPAADR
ncbi:MAG: lipid II flippase MurJ [Acidimicrobiales bacterium]